MLFNKKALSEEFKLKKILIDIKNIATVNPNAALSQLRTFIEMYTNVILIYEGKNIDIELLNKINSIKKFDLLTDDEIELMHQIRKSGNDAVHSYYYSKEEVNTYLEVCVELYYKLVEKYEKEKINYKKKLLKTYLLKSNTKNIKFENKEKEVFEKSYSGRLITENNVSIVEEKYEINKLKGYEYVKKNIIKNIIETKEIAKELEFEDNSMDITLSKLEENRFNLVVLGEFNRGKSTFLNALLGKVILPSNILPTTSVITRICYGEKPRVVVTLNDDTTKEIDYSELVDYVTMLNGGNDSNIKFTDIYYPINLCKYGCIITDTPGVNDLNEQNIIITENYIPQADAVVFILDSDQVLTESEKIFIKNKILKSDINKIFFIVNKFDNINRGNIDSFKKYVYNTIENLSLNSKVYFLSSKKALINKLNSIEDEYSEKFEQFNIDIEKFLIEEKGKYILLNGCNRLKCSINSIIKNIYNIESDASKDLDKLESSYRKFEKISEDIVLNKNEIIESINKEYACFRDEIKRIIYKELTLSFEKLLEDVYNQVEFTDTVFRDLENSINSNINRWINVRVNPFVLSRLNKINDNLMKLLNDSLGKINELNSNYFYPKKSNELVVQSSKFELPTCYSTVPSDYDKNTFIGAGAILTILLNGTLLSGIGGAFLGLITYNIFNENSTNNIKPKEEIIKLIENQKLKAINSIIREIEKSIDNNYNLNSKYIDESINTALKNTDKRMKSIIREKKIKNNDFEMIIEDLNYYLNKIYIIKKKNDLIIKYLEE